MATLMAAQYYSLYFYSLLSFFASRVITYSQFIIVLAGFTALGMLVFFLKHPGINNLFLFSLLAGCMVILAYFANMKFSGETEQQHTFFLVLAGQTFPAVLGSALVSGIEVKRRTINRILTFLIAAFSFLVSMAVLRPNQYAGGGGLTTEFVLNYQNGSYLCAYTAGFIVFRLVTGEKKKGFRKALYITLLAIDTFCMLAMGGKGGFVAYLVINGLMVIHAMRKKGLKASVILRNACIGFVLLIAGYVVISQVRGFSLGGNVGFSRLVSFFTTFDDSGRGAIYIESLRAFWESPLIGKGLGMIFNAVGSHSHNLLIDCLAETGIIGFSLLVALLVNTIRKCRRLIRMDERNWIVAVVFLQGLVISMFSGYYLAQVLLFSGIVLIQGRFTYTRKHRQLSFA